MTRLTALTTADVALALGGSLSTTGAAAAGQPIAGVSIDSRTLEAGRQADTMLFGVGAVSTSTTLFEGSYLDTRMLDDLISLGAVGEIGGRFFDADGVPVATELQHRTVSVPLEDVQRCAKTILISSGAAKHEATLGALRGQLARLLVCDIDCARWLLAQK